MNALLLGQTVKYKIEVTSQTFDWNDDDISVVMSTNYGKSKEYGKGDLIYDGEDYFLMFDTNDVGYGTLTCSVITKEVDESYESGFKVDKTSAVIAHIYK